MRDREQRLLTFKTREELAENLAEKISALLVEAIAAREKAVLVVSGGSTPKPLFTSLSKKNIPWNRVTITLADERWVDPTDPGSNEKMVHTYLLRHKAGAANFVGLKNNAPTPAEGEKECDERLAKIPRPFDAVILGMGNDGHTASLFPFSAKLKQAMDHHTRTNCLAVPDKNATYDRMTLTLPVLLDTRQFFLHITGKGKLAVLQQAWAGGPVEEKPIRAFLMQNTTPLQIFWAP